MEGIDVIEPWKSLIRQFIEIKLSAVLPNAETPSKYDRMNEGHLKLNDELAE